MPKGAKLAASTDTAALMLTMSQPMDAAIPTLMRTTKKPRSRHMTRTMMRAGTAQRCVWHAAIGMVAWSVVSTNG